MAQAILEQSLNECHKVFASEVVRALNTFYAVPTNLAPIPDEFEYLTEDIYWGILTVSYILREKNCEVFNSLRNGLKKENYFYECCMFIPTERDDRFFFNFLKRVSVIYDIAIFCYRNDDNYMETAQNCIAQFQDKEYFNSAGSWQRLNRIGAFLNIWGKRLRPFMIPDLRECFPVFLTTDNEIKTRLEGEGKFEEKELESNKNSRDVLFTASSCPVERKREFNSALVLLLAEENTDIKELGSIEDEIKALMRYFTPFLPAIIKKHYKELSEESKRQNDSRVESPKRQTSSTKSETATSLFCEKLAEEMSSNLTEKITLKSKYEELVRVIEETKTCFQECSVSSEKEENKIGYSTILEENLYLSDSSNDENFVRLSANKDSNENKIPSSGDLYQISDETTFAPNSDCKVSAKYTNNLKDADYIKSLEYDLFIKAGTTFEYTSFPHTHSDGTESNSAINSLADEGDSGAAQNNILSSENNDSLMMNIKSENKLEVKKNNLPLAISTESCASLSAEEDSDSSSETNNEVQLTSTKSVKSDSSEAAEKTNISNANNAKSHQRKTKRRKKKGKSKK